MTKRTDTLLARAFAEADAEEQADLLNHLAREHYVRCGGRDKLEMQCCYMSDKLNKDGIALIKQLHGFIVLREEDMPDG